jgi:DNA primase
MNFIDYLDERFKIRYVSGESQAVIEDDCPFCGGHGKMYVNTKTDLGICFKCSEGFNGIKFVMAHEKCSHAQAKKFLNPEEDYLAEEEEKKEATADLWFPPLTGMDGPGYDYMVSRGFSQNFCDEQGLAYCQSNIRLEGRKFSTGKRVIIPIRNQAGEVVSWQGRDITGKNYIKYLFPPSFRGAEHLYGIDRIKPEAHIIMCEGVMDVWGWNRIGVNNVVGTFGKKVSEYQVLTMAAMKPTVLFVAWDSDAAWEKHKFVEQWGHKFKRVMLVDLNGKDADECSRDELVEGIKKAAPYNWAAKILGKLEAI